MAAAAASGSGAGAGAGAGAEAGTDDTPFRLYDAGSVPDRFDFPAEEQNVLRLWKQIDAFKTQLKLSEGKPEFTFYDGPPFATGLPHYGHILAGTIKDVVTRYATQTGHFVSRRFGWDCHGLPVEYEIDKKLNITGSEQVMEMGIAKYNDECRSIVTRYCSEWETIVTRLGRWIDFKDDYKTMEPWYMESVWWVFKTIFEKNLVYRGFKVMPYSTACNTPLSNFEANLNYKDVSDPAVVVNFPVVGQENTFFLAWTTTPWTLPSNLALCVNATMTYVKVKDLKRAGNPVHYMMKDLLKELYKVEGQKGFKGDEFEVLEEMPGSALVGLKYTPLFDYFVGRDGLGENVFTVLSDGYVTSEAGTGIVHQAPAFGEDDYRVGVANGVVLKGGFLPCPVDANGRFTDDVPDFMGQHVKDADDKICAHLKAAGRLVQKRALNHSYPFCWRSETPLIYRAVPSWFVKVEEIKDRLVANNEKTYWVPGFVKEKRFHNWLTGARDWAISRNRYWGTPLPIWTSEDGEEVVVVGSIAELEELSGAKVTDLHRQFVDEVTIPSKKGKGVLRRVPEVFDCWFESGAMPYAQVHYPFKEKAEFEEHRFPADFIAEGLDQTRGWFYTLMVLSTALFDQPAFKNLIVNGLVLAEDGKKMSKRLKNYPDPTLVVDNHGADALRLYLVNSPVVRAEPLKFREAGVSGVLKEVFLPWYNAFRFFMQNAARWEAENGRPFDPTVVPKTEGNDMDHWVRAALHKLIKFVRQEMEGYRLYTVAPALVDFIDTLTNWYVRLNRRRLKGEGSEVGLACLYEVLMTLARLMAPMTPFLTEFFYQHLREYHPASRDASAAPDAVGAAKSVHFLPIPEYDPSLLDDDMVRRVGLMINVVELGRKARERRNISLKMPCLGVTIVTADSAKHEDLTTLREYVLDELHLLGLDFDADEKRWVDVSAEANGGWVRDESDLDAKGNPITLGKRLGKAFGPVRKGVAALTTEQIRAYEASGEITVEGTTLVRGEVTVKHQFKGDTAKYEAITSDDGSFTLLLDTEVNDTMREISIGREVANRVQKARKAAGLQVTDTVEAFIAVREFNETDAAAVAEAEAHKTAVAALPKKAAAAAGAAKGGAAAGAGAEGAGAGKKGGKKDKKAKKDKSKKGDAKGAGAAAVAPAPAPAPATPEQTPAEAVEALLKGVASQAGKLEEALGLRVLPDLPGVRPAGAVVLGSDESNVLGAMVTVTLCQPALRFAGGDALARAASGDAKLGADAATYAASLDFPSQVARMASDGRLQMQLAYREGTATTTKSVALDAGTHVFADAMAQLRGDPATRAAWEAAGFGALATAYLA